MWTAKERAIIRSRARQLAYTLRDVRGGGLGPVPEEDVDACERQILAGLRQPVVVEGVPEAGEMA